MSPATDIEVEKVVVTEVIPVSADKQGKFTVGALIETIQNVFLGEFRVVSLLYRRGSGLLVERQMPAESAREKDSFVLPYQAVRQYADVKIFEEQFPPLEKVCRGAMLLAAQNFRTIAVVARSKRRVSRWLGGVEIEHVLGVQFYEDPDAPADVICICGSTIGPLIKDVEYAVVCRMEAP